MQVVGNLFYIIIFVTMAGSLHALISLFIKKVLHIAPPLWFDLFGGAFFLIPIIVPQVQLVSPEETLWLFGYKAACIIWAVGVVFFLLFYFVRGILAYCALTAYPIYTDERISGFYQECVKMISLKQVPELRFGSLKDPACVITLFRPVVILNLNIIKQLTDRELEIVLFHELTHIRNKHHFFQRIYDFVCCFHWFNVFAWIAKNDFALTCEMNCDSFTLQVLSEKASPTDYATTMLHLMELSAVKRNAGFSRISALSFLLAKQRFQHILNIPSKVWRLTAAAILTLSIVLTIVFSLMVSRSFFYPYPANISGSEYSDTYYINTNLTG